MVTGGIRNRILRLVHDLLITHNSDMIHGRLLGEHQVAIAEEPLQESLLVLAISHLLQFGCPQVCIEESTQNGLLKIVKLVARLLVGEAIARY